MSGGALGSLNISLLLETVQFQQEMTKSAYLLNKQVGDMVNQVNAAGAKMTAALKGVAAAVGIGLSVDAFSGMVNGSIAAQEELGRLAEKAGMTGAQLSSLGAAAKLSHTGLEDVAGMSGKLSKALVAAQIDTSKQASVLKALGVTAAEVKTMLANPAEGLFLLSKRLQNFADDGSKSAATMLLMGKSASEAIPILRRLADQHELVATRTNEQIKAETEYEDKLVRMEMRTSALKTTLANALLPTMSDIVDAFIKMTNSGGGAKGVLDALVADGSIKSWAQDTAILIGTVAESLIFAGRGAMALIGSFRGVAAEVAYLNAKANAPSQKPFGSLGFSPEEAAKAEAEYQAAKKHRDDMAVAADENYANLVKKNATAVTDALKAQFAARENASRSYMNADRAVAAYDAAKNAKDKRPSLNIALDNPEADAVMRKQLEGQIKLLDAYIKQETQLLSQRESLLSRFYGEGLIGIENYFNRLAGVRSEEIQNVVRFYDQEIAKYEAAAKAAKKPAEAIDFHSKALEVAEKRNEALSAAMQKTRDAFYDNAKAARDYADSVVQTQAAIATAMGKGSAFSGQLFDIQHRTDFARAASNNDPEQTARLNTLKMIEEAEKRIGEIERANAVQSSLYNTAQGAIDLRRQSMNISEIESLRQKSALNAQYADILQAQADKQAEIARTLPGMVGAEAQAKVAAMRLQIEQLRAQTDLLGDRLQHTFSDDFVNALDSVLDRTKSIKDATKDLLKSFAHDINHVLSQNLADSLFGKGGPLGGIGGFFSSLLGKSGDAGSAASMAALNTATTSTAATMATLNAMASAAASSLAAVAASGGASSGAGIAKMFTGSGFSTSTSGDWSGMGDFDMPTFATGIDYVPHDMIAKIHAGERVVTAEDNRQFGRGTNGGSRVVNQTNNFNYAAPPDNRSRGQVASDAYIGASRASRVN